MIPLKITFYLSAPTITGDLPIHLDALLAWSVVHNAMDWEEDPFSCQNDLPLERVHGVWKASRLFFEPGPNVREMATKKYEITSMAKHKEHVWDGGVDKPSGKSGRFKGFLIYRDARWHRRAVAWCVGDRDEVTKLLANIHHVGKSGRTGFGEVDKIDVEPASAEEKEFWKLRNLPVSLSKEALNSATYGRALVNIEAPYWDRTKIQEALVPISGSGFDHFMDCANL